jgi:hypothetical protein
MAFWIESVRYGFTFKLFGAPANTALTATLGLVVSLVVIMTASPRALKISDIQRETAPNSRLDLTSPDAAQSVLRPLCSLSGLAAQAHVRHTEEKMGNK